MVEKLFERTEHPFPHTKIEIFSDGNDDYTYVLPDYYADTCINYGQLVKIKEKGKVIGKKKRSIYGNPDPGDIETTDIANFNGILRERNGRLARRSKCFSKRRWRLEGSIQLFLFYWNFINEFKLDFRRYKNNSISGYFDSAFQTRSNHNRRCQSYFTE